MYTYHERIPVNEIENICFHKGLLHTNSQNFTTFSQLKGLINDTHLTPGHYVFLMVWHRLVGDGFIHYRWFSLVIYMFCLPLLFLFAQKLFNSQLIGWIAVALFSVSPTMHHYSVEARYYMLWIFFFILTNYLFLIAIEKKKFKYWILYTVAGLFAFFTTIMTVVLLFGHFLYIILFKREIIKNYLITQVFLIVLTLPWLFSVITSFNAINTDMSWHILEGSGNFFEKAMWQILGTVREFSRLFPRSLYYQLNMSRPMQLDLTFLLIEGAILVFIINSFIHLFRTADKEKVKIVVLIIVPLYLFYFVSDIIREGNASQILHYQLVNLLIVGIVVSNLITNKLVKGKLQYFIVFVGLVIVGIISLTKESYGDKCTVRRSDCTQHVADAELLSVCEKPLIITDMAKRTGNLFSLLIECTSDSIDILYTTPDIKNVEEKIRLKNYSEHFVIQSSEELIENLKNQFKNKMVPLEMEKIVSLRKDSLDLKRISTIWQITLE